MNELHELSQDTSELTTCPVLSYTEGSEDASDVIVCSAVLKPMVTRTVLGDEYGSFPQYGVYFDCGHTFAQMEDSLKMGEYI